MILFSIDDTKRSIAKLMDGFKESNRKIMYGAHLKFNIGPLNKKYDELKVAQFGAFVADKAHYHHGETILGDVVVGMAQHFVGTNNIPWFVASGMFGTRFDAGKDAGETRYTYTEPEKLVPYILRKEDIPILTAISDDGVPVEPEEYYPVIPMILVLELVGVPIFLIIILWILLIGCAKG